MLKYEKYINSYTGQIVNAHRVEKRCRYELAHNQKTYRLSVKPGQFILRTKDGLSLFSARDFQASYQRLTVSTSRDLPLYVGVA